MNNNLFQNENNNTFTYRATLGSFIFTPQQTKFNIPITDELIYKAENRKYWNSLFEYKLQKSTIISLSFTDLLMKPNLLIQLKIDKFNCRFTYIISDTYRIDTVYSQKIKNYKMKLASKIELNEYFFNKSQLKAQVTWNDKKNQVRLDTRYKNSQWTSHVNCLTNLDEVILGLDLKYQKQKLKTQFGVGTKYNKTELKCIYNLDYYYFQIASQYNRIMKYQLGWQLPMKWPFYLRIEINLNQK